jgi:hypothetical protein
MSEADLQASIRDIAEALGYRVYHTHDSRRSDAGFPDLVMVRGERLVFRELKRAGKHPTEPQRAWIRDLEATGADVDVWRPDDLLSGRVMTHLYAKHTPPRPDPLQAVVEIVEGAESEGQGFVPVSTIREAIERGNR